jgi:peptidoglycan/LPS O-acetylase OafA/YrhL
MRLFYFRRLMRTIPSYLVVLFVVYRLWPGLPFGHAAPLWRYLTMTQNFGRLVDFGPSWSLCVEEHFYLVFPAVVLLIMKLAPGRDLARAAVATIAAVLLGELLLRLGIWYFVRPGAGKGSLPYTEVYSRYCTWIYYPTVTRLDGIVLGIALAALRVFRSQQWQQLQKRTTQLFGAGAVLLVMAWTSIHWRMGLPGIVFGFPLLGLAFSCWLIPASQPHAVKNRVLDSAVHWVAQLSYALYLVNHPAYHLSFELSRRWGWADDSMATAALSVACVLGAAMALYFLIEKPALWLRDQVSLGRPALATR